MRRGDFAAAWRISDALLAARRATAPDWRVPRHEQSIWDGRPLRGRRVLVRCYHGLGDTVQCARFLPELAELAREVAVWVQPPLLPLLRRLGRPLQLLPLHDGTPEVDYDVDIEIMELTHALRTTLRWLPGQIPYFDVAAEPRPGAGARRRIGLVARAGGWDPRRNVPPELMSALTTVPGVQWCNLQLESPLAQAVDISTPDVLTLAARLRGLDLVITVDTMMAHLAGALGVPTWTLLPADADWRWMVGRADSPWYPTMRLFRQPAPGDWESVLARVRAALAE